MVDVELSSVGKSWGAVQVIRNLDIHVKDEEFLVLLGPSGCGKTTTMRMIAGLEDVTSGDIRIGGQSVVGKLARERDIAMVFQNYGLYPHMSVADNIGYPLRLRKVQVDERRERVKSAARKVHLEDLLERKPRALSGGQRQRVALARAIVRTPRLFMLDEPLSNLDAKLRVSMRAELKHLHHEMRTTTIYVTHDQIEAMTLATRVAVMHGGRIVQLDTPENIYKDPSELFVAAFIGSPPMNLLRGTMSIGAFRGAGFEIASLPASLGGSVTLGIRPDDVALVPGPDGADIVATVFATEFVGQSTLVSIKAGDDLFCAVADANRKVTIGETVFLKLDRSRIFFFDTANDKRLRPA
ncbi:MULTISPECIES: ABC transporter ATP-binding protein [Phyllobacteriaceae]|uniref:ABC transporter ATP-binding protein n=1 Tax=Mesorhizobium hungaricum TaxID=1566387 RepID=A0A1C2DVU0_9HYPH|nr:MULTISPECIES: ABC transporter ATP-binding protein [Mesorhizobium]MBN9233963.1 ABC transporter ATP-binding protein [Mesorhizobium sp.]MDQ0331494.1 multiple sugar transport system ATP-binding protein [Mesorhizobium sp. YL-MeA3-2017]OCX18867.1 ABC transporter ATP-binding protein [Mesorhizobium hungaricum]